MLDGVIFNFLLIRFFFLRLAFERDTHKHTHLHTCIQEWTRWWKENNDNNNKEKQLLMKVAEKNVIVQYAVSSNSEEMKFLRRAKKKRWDKNEDLPKPISFVFAHRFSFSADRERETRTKCCDRKQKKKIASKLRLRAGGNGINLIIKNQTEKKEYTKRNRDITKGFLLCSGWCFFFSLLFVVCVWDFQQDMGTILRA